MNLQRILTVSRKTLRSLRHDRRTVAFLVLVPLLMIALFGYTFGGDLKDVKVDIVNLDQGVLGHALGNDISLELRNTSVLKVVDYCGPGVQNASAVSSSLEKVKRAEIWACVVIDQNFTVEVLKGVFNMSHGLPVVPAKVRIDVDSTNPNIATAIVAEVQKAVQRVLTERYGFVPPIGIEMSKVYGQDARFIDFFAPGVMGLAAMMVTFMLSIISFVHERSAFTLERVQTSPITEGEFVAGYALAFGLVGLVQSSVILGAAMLLFNIEIVGSPLAVLFIIFLLAVGVQGLGFLLSTLARTEFQAIQFLPLILFPSILLAGVFWPLEAVPEVLRPVSGFIPLTYAVDASRSVMIRGWGPEQVWVQLLILAAFAVAMLLLSALSLKRRG
ncbi:MAG: ABC-2 transporter permease [Methanomassiliicoccales archaeon]|nr:ABC-2 transporter permease [Methanomassiliicoccales archaeon]